MLRSSPWVFLCRSRCKQFRCVWAGKHKLTLRSWPAYTRGSFPGSGRSAQASLFRWPPSTCQRDPPHGPAAPRGHIKTQRLCQRAPSHRRSVNNVDPVKDPHGVRVENLPHTFQEGVPAAGQEGRQVCVDSGAHLAALLPTLQLDTGRETSTTSLTIASRWRKVVNTSNASTTQL